MATSDEIYNYIQNSFNPYQLNWESKVGKSKISYIPFSPDEDKTKEMRQTVENQRVYLAVRSFARAVQAECPNTEIKADNLVAEFEKLSGEKQKQILAKVIQKTPQIFQHGVNAKINIAEDVVVNIEGHGGTNYNRIWPVTKFTNDSGLTPAKIIPRMKDDLGENVRQLKLANCGSSGKFFEYFQKEAEKRKLHEDLSIFAYGGEGLMYLSKNEALFNLQTKGNRFVIDSKDPAYSKEKVKLEVAEQNTKEILGLVREDISERKWEITSAKARLMNVDLGPVLDLAKSQKIHPGEVDLRTVNLKLVGYDIAVKPEIFHEAVEELVKSDLGLKKLLQEEQTWLEELSEAGDNFAKLDMTNRAKSKREGKTVRDILNEQKQKLPPNQNQNVLKNEVHNGGGGHSVN